MPMSLSLRHRQPANAQRPRFGWLLISALLACLLFTSLAHAAPSPERVVVVANSADPVSGQIARYYMQKRGIPEKNLIELETSTEEQVSWDEFITTIYNPLRTRLILKDWLSGTISSQTDADGRIQAALAANNIDFLVLCRLPVKIGEDTERRNQTEKLPSQKEFQINRGSIDSELALMMHNNTPTIGFVANPLFGKYEPPRTVAETVVKVARLDGPSFDAVKLSLDSALEAERLGLRGRGYIDMGGPHGDGDRWIEQSGKILEHMGYPVSWDKERPLIGWKNRVDAAAFYFGWWTNDITGVFADPAFRFPPGAIAFHIHSYSAGYIRRPTNGWAGPLIARGAATTVGNVFEPYLQLTHRPNLFIEGMMKGLSAGEAAYYSLPVLSWMTVCLGDPLYQPFKTDLDAQLAQGLDHPDELSQYAVLRKMKLMRADKQYEDSFIYGVEQNRRLQGIALAFSLSRQYQMRGSRSKALEMLEPWLDRPQLDVSQWSMYYEVGAFLESIGENEKALGVYKYLIKLAADTPPALTVYYSAAIELAHRMGETGQAESWQSDLTRMQFEEQEKRVRQKMQNNRP